MRDKRRDWKIECKEDFFDLIEAGDPHPMEEIVFPIISCHRGKYKPCGTCFAIGQSILVTAKHNLQQFDKHYRDNPNRPDELPPGSFVLYDNDPEFSLYILYVRNEPSEPGSSHLLGGLVPVRNYTYAHCDLAVMVALFPVDVTTNEPLRHRTLVLSPGLPHPGESILTTGYHSMRDLEKLANTGQELTVLEYSQRFFASRGKIEKVSADARVSMVPPPTFISSAYFEHGMSGGPIIGQNRQVIGVVSSACELGDGKYYSVGTLIFPLLAMSISGIDHEDGMQKSFSILDLIKRNVVLVDHTFKDLDVSQCEEKTTFRFKKKEPLE